MKQTHLNLFFLLAFSSISAVVRAQAPELPKLSITTLEAQNTITWFCQFDGVKSIAIQRSTDSVRNFSTIGVLTAPKKGIQTYTDNRPLPGKNYYRLSVQFSGDMEWYSNTYKVLLDSAMVAKSLLGAVNTGTTNSKDYVASSSGQTNASQSTEFYYTPSSNVYTNPYTGHINITLTDASIKKYSVRFFDPSKKEVLRITRITKPSLVLDKNNFNSRGTYQFQLFDGTSLVETGYVAVY